MEIKELLKGIKYRVVKGRDDIQCVDLTDDSRKVGQGSCFFAIRGTRVDGLQFIDAAIHRGAVCVVTDRMIDVDYEVGVVLVDDARRALSRAAGNFYGNPSRDMGVIAVTGSDGKTSTTFLISAGAEGAGLNSGIIGTVFRQWPGHVEQSDMTTPDPLRLQQYLKAMKDAGTDVVAMEASSHALDQGRLYGVDVDVGVFTNLTRDHLDYHGSIQGYLEAKLLLFQDVMGDDAKGSVINKDDPHAMDFISKAKGRVVTYGFAHTADFYPENVEFSISGTKAAIVTPVGEFYLRTRLIGRHNIYNIMAAAASLYLMDLPLDMVFSGIEGLDGIPGRLERVDTGSIGGAAFVDYAHTPAALQNVLKVLRPLTKGKLIVVFGAGGDRDKGKRPLMGQAACLSDRIIITSDNPRTEDPLEIIRAIEQGVKSVEGHPDYLVIPDRREAICKGISLLGQEDTLLVAGKGHEDYQIIGTKKRPFDDRKIIRECVYNAIR